MTILYLDGPKARESYDVPPHMSPPTEIRLAGKGIYLLTLVGGVPVYRWRASK